MAIISSCGEYSQFPQIKTMIVFVLEKKYILINGFSFS